MDWITLTIEAMGIAIFCLWVVLPIGEFRKIFRRLKEEPGRLSEPKDGAFSVSDKREGKE